MGYGRYLYCVCPWVATLTYAPYAFLLWINPIIAAIYALTGLFQFKDESADKDKKSEEKNEKEEA